MLPEFTDAGVLPEGIHITKWDEFERRFEGSTAEHEYLAFFQMDREGRQVGVVEVTL